MKFISKMKMMITVKYKPNRQSDPSVAHFF